MKRTFLLTILALIVGAGIALAGMELTSARVYRNQRDWGKALQFYNQALQKEPDNLEAYEERGEVEHTLASDPSSIEIAKQFAADKEHAQLEMYGRMLADFKQATTPRKPDDESTVKKLKKKTDEILQGTWQHFYVEALKEDSASLMLESFGKTNTSADTVVKDSRGDVIFHGSILTTEKRDSVLKAESHRHLGTALKQLDMATKMLPEKWNAYGFNAQIFTKLDSTAASAENWKLALKYIQAADKSMRETDEYKQGETIAREALLIDYYKLGQNNDVLLASDEILKSDPNDINAIQLKANTLAKLASDTTLPVARRDSMKTVAISALTKAQTSDTLNVDICYTKGQFELQLGDTTSAMSTFSKCLTMNEKDKDILFVLGVLYLEGGSHVNTAKARDMFKRITELDPNNGPAWLNYGIALTRLGDTPNGVAAIKKGKALTGK